MENTSESCAVDCGCKACIELLGQLMARLGIHTRSCGCELCGGVKRLGISQLGKSLPKRAPRRVEVRRVLGTISPNRVGRKPPSSRPPPPHPPQTATPSVAHAARRAGCPGPRQRNGAPPPGPRPSGALSRRDRAGFWVPSRQPAPLRPRLSPPPPPPGGVVIYDDYEQENQDPAWDWT